MSELASYQRVWLTPSLLANTNKPDPEFLIPSGGNHRHPSCYLIHRDGFEG
jgi:hypothetical protein